MSGRRLDEIMDTQEADGEHMEDNTVTGAWRRHLCKWRFSRSQAQWLILSSACVQVWQPLTKASHQEDSTTTPQRLQRC